MQCYDYPYSDFVRDFDAVLPPLNAVNEDMESLFERVQRYSRSTYQNRDDSRERTVALVMSLNYISSHSDIFDVGQIAIRGDKQTLVSYHLVKALHSSVVQASIGNRRSFPKPTTVLKLAQKYEMESRLTKDHSLE